MASNMLPRKSSRVLGTMAEEGSVIVRARSRAGEQEGKNTFYIGPLHSDSWRLKSPAQDLYKIKSIGVLQWKEMGGARSSSLLTRLLVVDGF